LPKAGVLERHQLSVARQALHRFALEARPRVRPDVVPDTAGIADQEAAVDEAGAGLRFLVELADRTAFDAQLAEAPLRSNGGYGRYLAVCAVTGNQLAMSMLATPSRKLRGTRRLVPRTDGSAQCDPRSWSPGRIR